MSPAANAAASTTTTATSSTSTSPSSTGNGPERKRVKVYELRNNDWYDRGTGFCTGQHFDGPAGPLPIPDARIVVTSEDEPQRELLQTRISRDDGYQKQQDTLIVWTEQSGVDMALSFQEAEACASIWEFVNEVQQRLTEISGPDDGLSDDVVDTVHSISLPEPQLGHLDEVETAIRAASISPTSRDALAKSVMHPEQNYILKLAPLVTRAEELEATPDLHRLCTIMKHLILLNDTAIIEFVVSDQAIMGVVGALEYDPDFPSHRANHRQWLADTSKFKEVVPIQDAEVRRKIHFTYRLLYLKDVVLARILDDPTFGVLNSLIYFHQVDIVNHLQSNQKFLEDLFNIFAAADDEKAEKKREAVLFIQNCCAVSKNIQAQNRAQLYQNFIQHGLFTVITFALRHTDAAVRVAGTDILVALIDHDPHMVRNHIFMALREKTTPLTDTLIELLLVEIDLGVKSQMADALKILLDPAMSQMGMDMMNRSITAASADMKHRNANAGMVHDPTQRPNGHHTQTNAFIDNFYESSAKRLFAPLKDLEHRGVMSNLSVQETSLYTHLVEVLCFFVRQHNFKSKLFILSENLHSRVAQLLACPQKHMKLTALKWFRTCVALQDDFHNRQMVQNCLFAPVLQIVEETMPRDNLLNSACLELFEYIKREGVRHLIVHLVETYRERLLRITYVNTFHSLIERYEQFVSGYPLGNGTEESFTTQEGTPQRMINGRQSFVGLKDVDGEEEAYFNTDYDGDDEEDSGLPTILKHGGLVNGASPVRPLVSYPDDEDDDEVEGMDILASSPDPPLRENKKLSSSGDELTVPTEPGSSQNMDLGEDNLPSPGDVHDARRGRNRNPVAIEGSPGRQQPQSPPDSSLTKRRREDEDEDELGKMMGGVKRRNSSASLRSNASHRSQLDGPTGNPLGSTSHEQEADDVATTRSVQQPVLSHSHGHGNSHMLRRKGSLKVKNESSSVPHKFSIKPVQIASTARQDPQDQQQDEVNAGHDSGTEGGDQGDPGGGDGNDAGQGG